MEAKRLYFGIILFTVILFALVQTGCSGQNIAKPTALLTPTITETLEPINTLTPPSTPVLAAASITPHPTIDTTQQTWHATAIAIYTEERTAIEQSWNKKKDQIAQFPATCEHIDFYSSNISPDGKWLAASCGYKRNQTLTVQSKDGEKLVLDFKDFLSRESPKDIMGALYPKFWSPESNYLFFTIGLGYEGGGDDCFPKYRGDYGLFRLNLSTGSWSTVIPSTNSFPGYEIEFSPTGRRYAITLNGLMITDLQTGKSTEIATNETIEGLSWSADGKYLAYSLANCGAEKAMSSSIYIWNATTNQTQILFKMDGIMLRPQSWTDNSMLRIIGLEIINLKSFETIYEYSIEKKNISFTGTATPSP